MTRQIKSPLVNGVGAGQTATITLSPYGSYSDLQLAFTRSGVATTQAQLEAEIDEVRLLINGNVQQKWSVVDLFKHNAAWGTAPLDDGVIPILFKQPHRREIAGEDAMAWGMGGVASFTVEIDFAAGAVAPGLVCYPLWTPPDIDGNSPGIGLIMKTRHLSQVNVPGIGKITVPGIDDFQNYWGWYLKTSSIKTVSAKFNGIEMVGVPPLILHKRQVIHGLAPQAGWTNLFADYDRRIGGLFVLRQPGINFELELDMTAAVAFDMIGLVLGEPD